MELSTLIWIVVSAVIVGLGGLAFANPKMCRVFTQVTVMVLGVFCFLNFLYYSGKSNGVEYAEKIANKVWERYQEPDSIFFYLSDERKGFYFKKYEIKRAVQEELNTYNGVAEDKSESFIIYLFVGGLICGAIYFLSTLVEKYQQNEKANNRPPKEESPENTANPT